MSTATRAPHLSFGYGLHFCLGAALGPARRAASRSRRSCGAGRSGTSTSTGADGPHRQRARVGIPARPTRPEEQPWVTTHPRDVKRVVVWSTGGIGSLSIVAVNERPDLELVGVWVHSEDKVGKDAGELANGVPIGVKATNDVDALLALEAGLRDLRRERTRARRRRRARLRAPPGRGGERRHDDVDHAHQPAGVRAGAPRATRSRGARGRGVDLRLGHRARIPVRPAADHLLDRVAVRSARSTATRSRSTTTTASRRS